MKRNRAVWTGFIVGALGSLLLLGRGHAAQDTPIMKDVQKIADAVAKDDMAGAKKLAEKILKDHEDGLWDAMRTMKPREGEKVKGFGFGKKEDKWGDLDGIEEKVRDLAEKGVKDIKKEQAALVEMGHRMQAIAQVGLLFKVEKKNQQGMWDSYAKGMQDLTQDFVKAAKSGDPAAIKTAANKLDANCNKCHEKFR